VPPIRGVIFDLGRVLVDLDFSRGLLGHLVRCGHEDADAAMQRLRQDDLFVRLCRGELPPHAFHREACARLGLTLGYEEFVSLWCDIFRPMPGLETLFREVCARTRVTILSDTDPLHWEYLHAHFPMLHCVERPTLSFALRAVKPDPLLYRAAADHLGLPPADCFFTDDMPDNVAGARTAGMEAEVFQGAAGLRQHLVARGVL